MSTTTSIVLSAPVTSLDVQVDFANARGIAVEAADELALHVGELGQLDRGDVMYSPSPACPFCIKSETLIQNGSSRMSNGW